MGRVCALAMIVLVLSLAAGAPSAAAVQPPNPDPRVNPFAFEACRSKGTPGCERTLAIAGDQTARLRQRITQSPDPGRFANILNAADIVDGAIARARAQACGDVAPAPGAPNPGGSSTCSGLADELILDWASLSSAVHDASPGK